MGIKFRVPHTLVLLGGMIVLAWVLTLLLPAGAYQTVQNSHGRDMVVPGTFQILGDAQAPPVWSLLTVIPRGMEAAQGIIFFVFLIGGALAVIRASGAIDAGLGRVLARFGDRPSLLILMSILTFAIGSATIGMAEEYIPLTVILISMCVAMRMDTVTAVGSMVIGYCVGYAAAPVNPFTVLVAQEVAGLEPLSGAWFRVLLLGPFIALGFLHVWRYARRVRANPAASVVADVPEAQPPAPGEYPELTGRRALILWLAAGTIGLLVWGIAVHEWYLVELGAVFVGLAILVGLISGQSLDAMARTFTVGASELTGTALLIGFARAIELMLTDGQVLHTVVHGLATPLTQVSGQVAAVDMLLIQSVLNFFIPSGSGQAYVTMPLMAPISDIVGLSRQVAVLAYQMGDGLMNMVVPTNAVLMGILGICGIPFSRWLRFITPLILQCLLLGSLALVVAVSIGYS